MIENKVKNINKMVNNTAYLMRFDPEAEALAQAFYDAQYKDYNIRTEPQQTTYKTPEMYIIGVKDGNKYKRRVA